MEPPRGVLKKTVLKNFNKCTEKYLCRSLFVFKVADCGAANLFKRGSSDAFYAFCKIVACNFKCKLCKIFSW